MSRSRDAAERTLAQVDMWGEGLSVDQLLVLAGVQATLALTDDEPGDVAWMLAWLDSLDPDALERDALARDDAWQGGTRAVLATLRDRLLGGSGA